VIIIPAGWTNEKRGGEKPTIFIGKTLPSLIKHLKQFEAKAIKRDDQGDYWWELRHCAYYPEFEKEKVVWIELYELTNFCFVEKVYLFFNNTFIMTSK
jgi:adenine-specific DNA-methyltransferase